MKISVDLTPKQERYLIQLGLATLADQAAAPARSNRKAGGKKWTADQRRKFIASMAKVRAAKKRGKVNGHALLTSSKAAKKKTTKKITMPPWTDEHRRNYALSAKKRGLKINKLADALKGS